MHSPKISIIIPSFNQGQFIEETILSVLSQKYDNTEIIVIDGGSTDNTIDILKKYNSHFTYWISEKDNGQSEALNKGLQRATGEIVTWLNSDDVYEEGTLHYVTSTFISHPQIALLHGKTILFGKGKNKVIGLNSDISSHEYLPYMRFPQPSSFFRKELLDKIGPVNNLLHYAMDFELVVKAVLFGAKLKRTDRILSRYRLHENSKSNHDLRFLKEWAEVVYQVFNSLEGGDVFAIKLRELHLINEPHSATYSCSVSFTTAQLEDVFLEHLNLHYHYNYRAYNKAACKKISDFLKKNYSGFYVSKNYHKYNFRLKFIPKFVFQLIRKHLS